MTDPQHDAACARSAIVEMCEDALAAGETVLVSGRPVDPQRLKDFLLREGDYELR